ncbi:shikimate dehydrogenase [Pelosinus sp. sgz500959]|uniref:shikimate dehydrogenase n=1 Tax=Pelosinus sp. sgz500959 TaxID=3242472 RepID=UPI00366A8D6F
MITGKTKTLGILGCPVGHSLSPLMHNAAFAALTLDYIYVPLPVEPDHLGQAIAGLKAMGFVGMNVTIPHKVTVMPYLDEIHPSAQLTGAVNTIVIKNGKCIGYNTDGQGFIQSLTAKSITIKDKTAVIMGAGGAARAVVYGLLEYGIKKVIVGTRNVAKAQEFVKLFPKSRSKIEGCNWETESFIQALQECDILINCTPIGMSSNKETQLPIQWHHIKSDAAVCDLIYNPSPTDFLVQAEMRGHIIMDGKGMLVEQGALAFELWTGEKAPRKIMSETLDKFI